MRYKPIFFRELASQVGTAGDARQRLLKSAVRIIVENIVPDRMRVLFKICEEGSKWSQEEYENLFNIKPNHAESLLKTDRYNEYDRLHYTWGVRPSILKAVGILNKKSAVLFVEIKKAVNSLIRARNRILQLQWEFKHLDNPYDFGLTPVNVVNFMQYADKRANKKEYNIYSVYGIPIRKISKMGEDIVTEEQLNEITDSDLEI